MLYSKTCVSHLEDLVVVVILNGDILPIFRIRTLHICKMYTWVFSFLFFLFTYLFKNMLENKETINLVLNEYTVPRYNIYSE